MCCPSYMNILRRRNTNTKFSILSLYLNWCCWINISCVWFGRKAYIHVTFYFCFVATYSIWVICNMPVVWTRVLVVGLFWPSIAILLFIYVICFQAIPAWMASWRDVWKIHFQLKYHRFCEFKAFERQTWFSD